MRKEVWLGSLAGISLITIMIAFLLQGITTRLPVQTNESVLNDFSPLISTDFTPEPPTIEKILSQDTSWTATLSAERTTILLVTGDVLTARSVNAKNVRLNDFTWTFHQTVDELRAADITFINLETPLVPDCPIRTDGMSFCGDLRNVEGLTYADVDMVNLANNHMGNFGEEGVISTIEALTQAGISSTGITGPTIIDQNGIRFAFLGYNEVDRQPGVPYPSDELIRSEIEEARAAADVVVVQYHWGNEYTRQPSSNQRRLAQLAIDAGADLILGNHPHWWQPLELYQGKVIMYSHGNFVFDQMWSLETRQGLVGKYVFYDDQLIAIEFLPVLIEDYGQPRWIETGDKQEMLRQFAQWSLQLQTQLDF